ncbi:hypothetical protein GB937_010651 [Aspergillus fischeri]|nr:hypothetical protein GB937_010651 [Aspergillus fischeri]
MARTTRMAAVRTSQGRSRSLAHAETTFQKMSGAVLSESAYRYQIVCESRCVPDFREDKRTNAVFAIRQYKIDDDGALGTLVQAFQLFKRENSVADTGDVSLCCVDDCGVKDHGNLVIKACERFLLFIQTLLDLLIPYILLVNLVFDVCVRYLERG